VRLVGEVVGGQEFRDALERGVVDEDRAEQRPLGIDVVRQPPRAGEGAGCERQVCAGGELAGLHAPDDSELRAAVAPLAVG